MIKKITQQLYFIIPFLLLSIFLFKNPYSTRNLIANLEPFPDAQYYTTPPRCFLSGQSWKMCRLFDDKIEGIKPAVPPAYSLALLPAYFLNSDVRNFYFINVGLSLSSIVLLWLVAKRFFNNKLITGVVLLLYATNYFVYWYPTLAMAENLFLPLFLLSIYLLQNKVSTKNSILIGLVSVGFYATKYAYAPLTVLLPIIYFAKIILSKKESKEKLIQTSFVAIPAGLILSKLVGWETLLSVLNQVTNGSLQPQTNSTITSGSSYFSINYFAKHFTQYSKALIGESQRFLWDSTPLTEKWIALPGLLGLFASLKNHKQLPTKLYLILSAIAQLLFISTFYVVDIRYVYHFLPILILGFGFFIKLLSHSLLKNKINFYAFITMILIIYLGSNVIRLKSVIMINLKYAETPWWYLSQLEMNNFFKEYETDMEKPYLITLASPFLTDNYSNQNYRVLPLNDQQDFKSTMNEVWGNDDYEDLIELYKNKLENEQEVFITNYGINATSLFEATFKNIENNFTLTQVHSGCHNLCNIYQLQALEVTESNPTD